MTYSLNKAVDSILSQFTLGYLQVAWASSNSRKRKTWPSVNHAQLQHTARRWYSGFLLHSNSPRLTYSATSPKKASSPAPYTTLPLHQAVRLALCKPCLQTWNQTSPSAQSKSSSDVAQSWHGLHLVCLYPAIWRSPLSSRRAGDQEEFCITIIYCEKVSSVRGDGTAL